MSRPIAVAPSVLPVDFARLGDECMALEKAGVDLIHWDVMDGVFVPNLTFGPDVIASTRSLVDIEFEAHLMVVEPDRLLDRYVEAGCSTVLVHAEACGHLHRTVSRIKDNGNQVGVAITPGTAISATLDAVLITAPPPAAISFGMPYLHTKKVPNKSRLMARQNSSSGASVTISSLGVEPPALL